MIWALHGMVGDPSDWDFLGPNLPVRARQLWSEVDRYGAWAAKFCNSVRLEDKSPVLLGYSMGGRLALHALLDSPGLWKAAVIVSAHTGLADRQARRVRWRQDDEWAAKVRQLPWEIFLKLWNGQSVFSGSALPGQRMSQFQWRQAIIRAFADWGLSRQDDLLPRLSEIKIPVLWICGEHDVRYTALGRSAVEALPDARLEILPGCGHRVPWEAPEAFTKTVLDFLRAPS